MKRIGTLKMIGVFSLATLIIVPTVTFAEQRGAIHGPAGNTPQVETRGKRRLINWSRVGKTLRRIVRFGRGPRVPTLALSREKQEFFKGQVQTPNVTTLTRELSAVARQGQGLVSADSEVARSITAAAQSVVQRWEGEVGKLRNKQSSRGFDQAKSLKNLLAPVTQEGQLVLDTRAAKALRPTVERAYQLARAEGDLWLGIVDGFLANADVEQGRNLNWVRDLRARPGSDWGIYGVGEVFAQKRSALTNLEFAKQHLLFVRHNLDSVRWVAQQANASRWLRGFEAKLAEKESALKSAREALAQATPEIWRYQQFVTVGADAGQRRILEAMFLDGPENEAVIEEHVQSYIRGKYGR